MILEWIEKKNHCHDINIKKNDCFNQNILGLII